MLLGDSNMDEYLETLRASSIVSNPYNKLFELDTTTFTQFLAVNGFSTTVCTDVNPKQCERHLSTTRNMWCHLAHSLLNWPVLRRAMRDCKLQNTPVSAHVTPSAARIHINTRISNEGRNYILRCLCERIATKRLTHASHTEQDLLERFADEDFLDEFTKSIINTPCGPFWFILHDCSDQRKIRIDKIIRKLALRIMSEPTTDLEENSKLRIAITHIRKLWDDLCNAIPRIESYFGLCDVEPTQDIRILHDVFKQFGMKVVKIECVRRTMDTSQLLTFPLSDVQLDSIDAILVIHFFQEITQHDESPGILEFDERRDRPLDLSVTSGSGTSSS